MEFHNSIKRAEDILNSDASLRRFGSAGVCDGASISLTPDRIAGSRGITDKNNDIRKCRGVGRKGRREVNCAELRENHEEIDNHHTQIEFGNCGNGAYRSNWGDRASDVRCAGGRLFSQSI